jgi:hypothetical protein
MKLLYKLQNKTAALAVNVSEIKHNCTVLTGHLLVLLMGGVQSDFHSYEVSSLLKRSKF